MKISGLILNKIKVLGLFCLLLSFFSQAAVAAQESLVDVSTVYVSEYFGEIDQRFSGKGNKTVIHIQDAHCDYVAQQNIVKLIKSFVDNYKVKLVAVEGSRGDIDTTLFASYPNNEVKQNVADYFLKIGQVTGPEYLSINSKEPFFLVGIENKELYVENVEAFRKAFADKEKTDNALDFFNTSLSQLGNKIYSNELKYFSDMILEYANEEITFSAYSSQLMTFASQKKIKLDKYSQFQLLLKANELAEVLIFEEVDKERSDILKVLPLKMQGEELQEFISLSLKFKEKEVSYLKYYLYLKDKVETYGLETDRLTNFLRYTNYLKLLADMDKQEVSQEEELLLKAILEKLSNAKQKELFVLNKNSQILTHLFEIKMDRTEYLFYKDNKSKFRANLFNDFVSNESVKYGLTLGKVDNLDVLDREASVASKFYELALKRENVFVDQLLFEMQRRKVDTAILVTGGFHSLGIAEELKKKNISYAVITPVTDKENQAVIEETYNNLLSEKKLPFQTFLEMTSVPDAVPGVISFNLPKSNRHYVFNKVDKKLIEGRANVLAFDSLFNKMLESGKSSAFVSDFVSKLVTFSVEQGDDIAAIASEWIELYAQQKNGMGELIKSLGITDQALIDSFAVDQEAISRLLNEIISQVSVSVESADVVFPKAAGNVSRVIFKETGATLVYHNFAEADQAQRVSLSGVYQQAAGETIDSKALFFKSMELNSFLKLVATNVKAFFGNVLSKQNWQQQLRQIEDNWGLSKQQKREFFGDLVGALGEEIGVNENQVFAIDFDLLAKAEGLEMILDAYKGNTKAQLVVFGVKDIAKSEVETLLLGKGYSRELIARIQVATFEQLPSNVTSVIIAEKNKGVKDQAITENLWVAEGRWNIIAQENSYLPVLFEVLSSIKEDKTLTEAIVSLKEVLNMDENEIRELLAQPFPVLIKATNLINNISFAKEAVSRAA